MKLICRGKVNEKHFIKALSMLSALEIPKELELYIIDDPKYCKEVIRPLPPSQKPIFRSFCNRERTSFSYSWGGREIVLIQIAPQNAFITKNLGAAAGLLAHELTHTILRRKGLDRHLAGCYEASYYSNFKLLHRLKLPRERLDELFNAVGAEALLALKDVYVNSEVLSMGLGDYLLEYYYHRLETLRYCPMPPFKDLRRALKSDAASAALRDALRFQLTLLPIYAPFKAYRHKKAKLLMRQVKKCYEQSVEDISSEFGDVQKLVLKEFSPSCTFHRKYFSLVFLKTFRLLI